MRLALLLLLVLLPACGDDKPASVLNPAGDAAAAVDEHAGHDHGDGQHTHDSDPVGSAQYEGLTTEQVAEIKRGIATQQTQYASAISEVDIDKFLVIQRRFLSLPDEAKHHGLTGMAAGHYVKDEFGKMLLASNLDYDSWSKLYQRLKRDVKVIEEGQTTGHVPHYEEELDLVRARLVEIVGAFQANN